MTMYRYTDILKTIRTIASQAHIGGGAVRDTLLDKPIHDIDIFVDDAAVNEVATTLRSQFGYIKVGEWQEYLGFSDPAMTRVAKFEKAEEIIPLCVIGLKSRYASPEANIARFDFGVCMAAFDGESTLRAAEFDDDVNEKAFTLLRADNFQQFAYSMSRYKKITSGRYQGWTLTVPGTFQELAEEYSFRKDWYIDSEAKWYGGANIIRPKDRVIA
jgi:hypothetical protein